MARSRETKIELTAYDDLFQTDESREEAKLSKIRDIPISEIDEFPDHPFKVLMDEDMEQLVESIKRNGVMTPATVRLKEDGRYELISGHRRKKACELAGVEKIGYIQKLLEQEKTELPPEEKTEAPATDRHNFRIIDDAIGVGGAKEKFRNNMAAINLLHELEIENRLATPEEQEVLSRYVGWGGLSMAFDEHKQSISEGAMTALGISKRQEFCNQERRHWRGADAAFT